MSKRELYERPFVMQVGARIRFLRFENGLSLRSMAQKAQCSADTILRVELGRSAMNTRTLHRIARALQVEPIDLLNHDTEHDDVAYIVEKIRQDPEVRGMVMARVRQQES